MQNPPPPTAGPPADYFMTPPAPAPTAPGYAQPAWAQPQPAYTPPAGAGWGFFAQFSGVAGWACVIGLVTVVVPLFFGRVFFFLPILGVIYGIRAISRGAVVGGAIGAVLSAIGGILAVIGLTVR